ncbi:MAG: beta-glucosidase BglX [Bacteroidales bacterium]
MRIKKNFIAIAGMFLFGLFAAAQNSKMDAFITDLMNKMTLEEKLGQLNLSTAGGFVTGAAVSKNMEEKLKAGAVGGVLNSFSFQNMKALQEIAVKESPHHIPLIFGMDVIHGYRTIFPIPLGLSCTWDVELIKEAARIAASEATAAGICWTYSPMVDIARDPRWGRIAEGAGEDPWWGARVATALVEGYQGNDLSRENTMMACVKHFALYGAAEAGRDYNTVDMSRITMYNFFLPPYKAAVDAGAGSVMTSFNVVDYIPATGNHWLLTDLLRNQWGFKGFVVTDYTAINEMVQHGVGDLKTVSALALKAGTDMDMVGEGFLTTLKQSLEEGKVTLEEIDRACRRILEAKYKLGLFDDPFRYLKEERLKNDILTKENVGSARKIAARSLVLFKNEHEVLPLKKGGTIALIGPLADDKANLLGTWTLFGDASKVVSIREGLQNAGGNSLSVLYSKGTEFTDDPLLLKNSRSPFGPQGALPSAESIAATNASLLKEALAVAKKADVVVAVLGEMAAWSGEAASRADIGLPACQKNLLKALKETGKPVVLVLINGRPLVLNDEAVLADAILEAWAPGMQGGNAIADVLFGDYNPSGKLTTTFPQSVGQIPLYYNHLNTGRPADPRNKFTSKYLDIANEPLFPFGYGLSYTTFEYSDITLNKTNLKGEETLLAGVTITNTGKMAGEEVVQLYLRDPVASISRPVKELKNCRKIFLKPGEKQEVVFRITPEDLKFYNSNLEYDWEPGEFIVMIGGNSRDVKEAKCIWNK